MNSSLTIMTLDQLNALLNRHPYLRDRPNYEKQHLAAQQYLVLKHLQRLGELDGTTLDTLSERTGQARMTISHWLHDRHKPRLITNIEIHEHARRQYEAHLHPKALQHRLDPSTTYHLCKTLRNTPKENFPEAAAKAIERLLEQNSNPNKVVFTEFRPYHHHGSRWINTIARSIHHHRDEIETHPNTRLHLTHDPHQSISLGVVNHTLYLWHRHTNPNTPLNAYANEPLTLNNPHLKEHLLQDTLNHLNFPDPNRGFLKLIDQITNHPNPATDKITTIYDLRDHGTHRHYIFGESLHFLLDATNTTFADIRPQIQHIGRNPRYGIHNPQFPEGAKRNELRARLLAIYLSDGHVNRKSATPEYAEKEKERVEYVVNLLKETFGDAHMNLKFRGNVYKLNSTTVLGRQLESWGVRKGAKHLQSFELPSSIKNGSIRVKRAYIEELIPEEGSFIHTEKTLSFAWRRVVVLDAGSKNKEYNFEPKISQQQKDFIVRYGKEISQKINTDEIERTRLRSRELQDLVNKANNNRDKIIATQLFEIIEANRCTLMDDEGILLEILGIKRSCYSELIRVFKNGRVSTSWVTVVNGQDDILRWSILAPPSSGRKRVAVRKWLSTQEKANSMFERLKREGLLEESERKWWKSNENR